MFPCRSRRSIVALPSRSLQQSRRLWMVTESIFLPSSPSPPASRSYAGFCYGSLATNTSFLGDHPRPSNKPHCHSGNARRRSMPFFTKIISNAVFNGHLRKVHPVVGCERIVSVSHTNRFHTRVVLFDISSITFECTTIGCREGGILNRRTRVAYIVSQIFPGTASCQFYLTFVVLLT